MIVGFDFDNTLINYTNSFKELARKKKAGEKSEFSSKKSEASFFIRLDSFEKKLQI